MQIQRHMTKITGFVSKKTSFLKISSNEHRAAIDALNIFFGAMIGVHFGEFSGLSIFNYVLIILITVAAITYILYITHSKRKLLNMVFLAVMFYLVYYFLYIEPISRKIPEMLFPSLLVWGGLAVLIEYSPRETGNTEQ